MIRTQIYLPKSQIDELQKIARRKRTSVSELIRAALRAQLAKPQPPAKKYKTFAQSLAEIKRLGERGPKDLSLNVDKYLYGRTD